MRKVICFAAFLAIASNSFAANDLLVCSLLSDQVLRFDGTTGTLIGVFADTHLDGPEGITVGPDGNVYVASEYSENITKWSPSGAYLGDFVPAMAGWEDLEFGPDGNLYAMAHFGEAGGPISKFDGTSGAYLGQWGAGAAVSHQHGLTFGPDGNPNIGRTIFGPVGSIGKIDQGTGTFVGSVATDPHIDGIFDLVFHGGLIYTSDHLSGAIHRFNPVSGAYMGDFVSGGDPSWGMIFHTDGWLYVSSGGSVVRYDASSGALHDTFATGIGGSAGMAFVPVPEPGSLVALAVGLASILIRNRRRVA